MKLALSPEILASMYRGKKAVGSFDHYDRQFWSRVTKDEKTGCWNWTGSGKNRYGLFWTGTRYINAHWYLLDTWPTDGLVACHSCDNTRCVNPDHIWLGTRSENILDSVSKGRYNRQKGSQHYAAILTEEQALLVKACPDDYGYATALARKLNVTKETIYLIRSGRSWKHLRQPTEDERNEVRQMLTQYIQDLQ
jgi:hypothetical protein